MTKTDLNELIIQNNPFSAQVATEFGVWSDDRIDVSSIHQTAFASIVDLIERVENEVVNSKGVSSTDLTIGGIALLGERGVGKTQLLGRLRQHFSKQNNAFFVYMAQYEALDQIKSEFLSTLVYSLKRECRPGVTQWQEIAASIVFDAKGDQPFTVERLVKIFPEILQKNPKTITNWTNYIAKQLPEINNVYLIRAILWTLHPQASPYATMWLAGQELDQSIANRLNLPPTNQSSSFAYTLDLLNLITRYKTVVICFDELDNLGLIDPGSGLTLAQTITSFAKELLNSAKRIVVIVSIISDIWKDQVRLADRRQETGTIERFNLEIELRGFGVEETLSLVGKRLDEFYKSNQVLPPNPFYPFDEKELRQVFASERSTARQILKWCETKWDLIAQNLKTTVTSQDQGETKDKNGENVGNSGRRDTRVTTYLKQEEANIANNIDALVDGEKGERSVIDALRLAFNWLKGKDVGELRVFDVEEENDKQFSELIPFKVKVRKSSFKTGPFTYIAVTVLQRKGNTLTAILNKLKEYKPKQTRLCLIRSDVITGKVALDHVKTILMNGGEWIELANDHILPLLALKFLVDQKERYDLTEDQIKDAIDREGILTRNALIDEILSKPENDIPNDATVCDILKLRTTLKPLPISIDSTDDDDRSNANALTLDTSV